MNAEPPEPGPQRNSLLDRFLGLLSRKPRNRQQLIEVLRGAESAHLIDPETLAMMEGALLVLEMRVRDIMVPRSDMVVVADGADPREYLPTIIESGHSRFPLMDTKRDQVIGILLAKDLLAFLAQDPQREFRIKDVLRPAVFVPESKRLNILLREFRTSRNHMAIVVDEYGGTAGLVSIEDVLEQIVGEIDDEHDFEDEDFIRLHSRDRYTVKARTPIEEFNAYFKTALPDQDFDTVGGLVLKEFGRLPLRGEELSYRGFNFRVLRADKRRIHTLRVVREEPPAAQEPG